MDSIDLSRLDTYAPGYKPNYPHSPSNTTDWLSTQSNASHVRTAQPPQFSTWLPGTMAKLPLELVYNLLDQVLIGQTDRLTHGSLHGLLSLRAASKHTRAMVTSYMQSDLILTYLRQQLFDQKDPRCVKWYQCHPEAFMALFDPSSSQISPTATKEHPGSDIITDIIVDDCPECFDALCRSIDGLGSADTGCNESGWTFISIAIRSGSYRMLQRFFLSACSPSGYDPPSLVLMSGANCVESGPTILGMLAYQQDPVFAEKVLDLVAPIVLQVSRPSALAYAFTSREKDMLCKYITPRTGEWLTHLGIKLWERTLYSSTSSRHSLGAWHAAVHNGPEFMKYLYKYSPTHLIFSGSLRGAMPIDHAVWANRLDSFRWLFAKFQLVEIVSYRMAIERLLRIVANHTSPESEVMLEEILLGPGPDKDNFYVAALLFKNIALGLKEAVMKQSVRSDMNQKDLDRFRDEHEQIAVRKCLAISRVFFNTGLPMKVLTKAQASAEHFDAVLMAKQLGFEYLESKLYSYHRV
ncbi:hypothetical protein N7509_003730 [Penicillium cosmopolitanum]|uniref:Uncharacterized protein n=1 Tax=Penicillium cosmopolitanum TaxID=1131564 RepID=A0A9X0BBS5_9EURO|nr:uncharacterized protein N7509_003730 [Penicillium cosmopolitanum]KAJ5403859.1 hypothetical protein N7509_003730 [Penicillium cosmopolitanum]